MNHTQNVVLDSCVVIAIMEAPKTASRLRARMKGKSIRIILCDVVLKEVRQVRGYTAKKIEARVSSVLGRKTELLRTGGAYAKDAQKITAQFQVCHNGDNRILSLCRARDYVLVTFDRMLLKASQFVGVAAFHPSAAGGI